MEKQEKSISNEFNEDKQNIDANQENGSSGIITKIRDSICRQLKIAALLAVLASSTMQTGCKQTEEIEIGQKARSGETIIHIYPKSYDITIYGKRYKYVKLQNGIITFINPGTLEILRIKSGKKIVNVLNWGKIGNRDYCIVQLENNKVVAIDPSTLDILRTKSGEKITRIYPIKPYEQYQEVELENGNIALVDIETLKIKRRFTRSSAE